MSCKKCAELQQTPIFFTLLQDTFKMTSDKVIEVFHKKGHKIF